MLKNLFLFVSCFVGITLHSTENPIIYLVAPPRSLSTVFTRMMLNRGDFSVFSEPSQFAYVLTQEYQWSGKKTTEVDWEHDTVFRSSSPKTFEEVKAQFFKESKTRPVFVKEISFAVVDFLQNDLDFVKNPQVHFVFLIRNPHHAIISFYNKLHFFPKNWDKLVGYENQYHLFQYVKKHARHQPLIVQAEDLYSNPEEVIQEVCQKLQIPYLKDALKWEVLPETFNGNEWHEVKYSNVMQAWHDEALKSCCFHLPTKYEEDNKGNPTFSEITDDKDQLICKEAYVINKQFYDKLLQEKDFIILKPSPEQTVITPVLHASK